MPTLDDYIAESETYDARDTDEIPDELKAEIDEKIDAAHSA